MNDKHRISYIFQMLYVWFLNIIFLYIIFSSERTWYFNVLDTLEAFDAVFLDDYADDTMVLVIARDV